MGPWVTGCSFEEHGPGSDCIPKMDWPKIQKNYHVTSCNQAIVWSQLFRNRKAVLVAAFLVRSSWCSEEQKSGDPARIHWRWFWRLRSPNCPVPAVPRFAYRILSVSPMDVAWSFPSCAGGVEVVMGNFQVQPMPHCWKLSAPAGMMTCRKGEWKESKGTGTVWHLKHYIIVPSCVWSCSRKLAVASWSYSCFSKGSPTQWFFTRNHPPSSRGILKRSWKQMVTGSNPARSLGNLYSAYQNPIIFQA